MCPTAGCSGPRAFSRILRARLEERLGLGELTLRETQLRQVGERVSQVDRLGIGRLLADRQGLLVMQLGLGVVALDVIERPQVVQA